MRLATVLVALGVAAVVLLGGAPPAHAAKKRVVVLGFSGPQAGKAEVAVGGVVARKYTLVSAGQYSKAQKKLRLKKPSNANVARIANEIQVDAIVAGSVKRKGARWSLVLVVREGATGNSIGTIKITLRSPRIDAKAKQDIIAQLLPAIGRTADVAGSGGGRASKKVAKATKASKATKGKKKKTVVVEEEEVADEEEEEEAPPPPKKAKKGKKVAKVVAPSPDPEAEDEDTPTIDSEDERPPGMEDPDAEEVASNDDGESEESEESDSAIRKKKRRADDDGDDEGGAGAVRRRDRYARRAGLDIAAGVSFVGRSMTFTADPALADQPNGYDGRIVPGAFFNAELYPLALGGGKHNGPLAGLGAAVTVDRVISIKSKIDDPAAPMGFVEFATTQTAWGVGLRYRLPIGSRPTLPTVKLGFGYNHLDFTIDTGAMDIDLPNVAYSYIDAGGSVRVPLGERLAIEATGRYLVVVASGDISLPTNYGGGKVNGLDVSGSLEYRPTPRFTLRGGARYMRIAFDFDGTGNDTTMRDMDPDQDVGGALDVYLGFFATAGYLF